MRKLLGQVKEMFSCGVSKNYIHNEKAQQINLAQPFASSRQNSMVNKEMGEGIDKDGVREKRVIKGCHSSSQLLCDLQTSETICRKIEKEDSDHNQSLTDSNKVKISSRQLDTCLKQAKILLNSSTISQTQTHSHTIIDKTSFNFKSTEQLEKPLVKSIISPKKPPMSSNKSKSTVASKIQKDVPKTISTKKKSEASANFAKPKTDQGIVKQKTAVTTKNSQTKKIDFKNHNKVRTVEIEVNNVDVDHHETNNKSAEEQFAPSSQSAFTFKPKFYKPTQVINNSCQSSMMTMRNLSNSTPEIKLANQLSDTTNLKTTLFGEDFNADQI